MDNLINTAKSKNVQSINTNLNAIRAIFLVTLCTILITSCQKQGTDETVNEASVLNSKTSTTASLINNLSGIESQTKWELQQARASTARYRDLKNALKDGYED